MMRCANAWKHTWKPIAWRAKIRFRAFYKSRRCILCSALNFEKVAAATFLRFPCFSCTTDAVRKPWKESPRFFADLLHMLPNPMEAGRPELPREFNELRRCIRCNAGLIACWNAGAAGFPGAGLSMGWGQRFATSVCHAAFRLQKKAFGDLPLICALFLARLRQFILRRPMRWEPPGLWWRPQNSDMQRSRLNACCLLRFGAERALVEALLSCYNKNTKAGAILL